MPRTKLLDLIDSLQRFAISRDTDLQLERDTTRKWKEAQRMQAKPDRRELGTDLGLVLDGAVLAKLYREREVRAQKAAGKVAKQPSTPNGKKSRVQFASPVTVASSEDSFMSIEDWDTTDVESDSSMEPCIIVSTPRPRHMHVLRPSAPPSPLQQGSHRSASTFRTSTLPVAASTPVLRSRSGAK